MIGAWSLFAAFLGFIVHVCKYILQDRPRQGGAGFEEVTLLSREE